MESERPEALFDGSWPKLKGYSPGQAAWNRARHYAKVPAGVELRAHQLLYVAVDHLFEGAVRLVVSRWPKQGVAGRLTFGNTIAVWQSEKHVGEIVASERLMPAAEWLAPALQEEVVLRPLAVGDVFATRLSPELDALSAIADMELEEWFMAPMVDISAEMRVEAKAAFYSAVAPVLEPDEAVRIHGEE